MKLSERVNYNAASPEGMRALGSVQEYLRKSGLAARLIDLAFLRVSQINGCAYCIDLHSRDLLKSGLPTEHLVLVPVWREAEGIFNEEERAALAWAEAVTCLADHGVPNSAFEHVAATFGEKQLVDLTIAIAIMNAYNRISVAFRATPIAVQRARQQLDAEAGGNRAVESVASK